MKAECHLYYTGSNLVERTMPLMKNYMGSKADYYEFSNSHCSLLANVNVKDISLKYTQSCSQ